MVDLTKYLIKKKEDWSWQGGDQFKALKFYLDTNKVKILYWTDPKEFERYSSYLKGTFYVILKCENKIILWTTDFNERKDEIDGLKKNIEGYNYIKRTLQKNTKQFNNFDEAIKFTKNSNRDKLWSEAIFFLYPALKMLKHNLKFVTRWNKTYDAYECNECGCDDIMDTYKYCPRCGKKIS